MAGYNNNFNDELRARLSIVDVVSRRVPLTKKGKDFWGCCPFHNEKTPSFKVSEDMGRYYCFGCGEKGDIISFVMKTQNMQYGEAIRELADMAGLKVPEYKPRDPEIEKREHTYHQIMESAAQTFQKMLYEPAGKEALEYLQKRGFDDEKIKKYRLGYAPKNNFLAAKFSNVNFNVLESTGLVRAGNYGPRDFFFHRLMFPIMNPKGQIIAFSGRSLDGSEPKYINTSDTEFFHKRQTLFGLNFARDGIHRANRSIVVEGQIDAIQMQTCGFPETVAPLGTALTEQHLQLLCKLNRNIIFCFDGDGAGKTAAGRAAGIVMPLIRADSDVRFAFVTGGKDPDDILKKPDGKKIMRDIIDSSTSLTDFLWKLANDNFIVSTPGGRTQAEKFIRDNIEKISDIKLREEFRHEYDNRKFNEWHKWRRSGAVSKTPVPEIDSIERQNLSRIASQYPSLIEKYSEFFIRAKIALSELDKGIDRKISEKDAENFIKSIMLKYDLNALVLEKQELTPLALSGNECAAKRIREIDCDVQKLRQEISHIQEDYS